MAVSLRSQVTVAPLTDERFEDFSTFWVERRVESGAPRDHALRAVRDGRFAAAVGRADVIVLLALAEGQIVAYAWVAEQPLSTLVDSAGMAIEDLYVRPGQRRRGVGKALLLAAAAHAQRVGAEHVACSVPAQSRDTHRILARLGFAPSVTRRTAPTSGLVRRLRGGEPRTMENLVVHRRRRSLRARTS